MAELAQTFDQKALLAVAVLAFAKFDEVFDLIVLAALNVGVFHIIGLNKGRKLPDGKLVMDFKVAGCAALGRALVCNHRKILFQSLLSIIKRSK